MIRLVEYRAAPVVLDEKDLKYLLAMVKGTGVEGEPRLIESITPTTEPGTYLIRPGGFVGRLGLPSGEAIDFGSRFPFADLIELIRHSKRAPLRVDELEAPAGSEAFIVDVLAAAFAREVNRLVAGGLAKGYRSHRFERPPYPGPVDINLHLGRYAARPDRLVTRARRITHDIELNRAIALALDVLQRVRVADSIRHSVARLGPAFVRIGRKPMSGTEVARIPLTRLTNRYEQAIGLAELILTSRAISPRETDLSGASILFNMPKVWEDYVARWVASAWGDGYRVEPLYRFDLTADGALSSEADVIVWDGDELVALYDAKYKFLNQTPAMGDVYQMVTYCIRLGLDEATLVYPGNGEERSFRVENVTVRMKGLPVMSTRHLAVSHD